MSLSNSKRQKPEVPRVEFKRLKPNVKEQSVVIETNLLMLREQVLWQHQRRHLHLKKRGRDVALHVVEVTT